MRESPTSGLPKTAEQRRLKALAAFAAGMLIAIAAALIFVHMQRRGALQATNVARPEPPHLEAAEVKPPWPSPTQAGNSAATPDEKRTAGPDAAVPDDASGEDDGGPEGALGDTSNTEPTPAGPRASQEAPHPAPVKAASVISAPASNDGVRKLPVTPARAPQQVAANRPSSNAAELSPDPVRTVVRPRLITLQPGTLIPVRLVEPLSSDRNHTGDTFQATLASSLVVNGAVLARAGSAVLGTVVHVRKAHLIGGAAELSLGITDITASDGRLVKVDSDVYQQNGAHSSLLSTAKMTTGAAIGAVVGALTGAAEGAGISSGLKRRDRTNGFMATKRVVVLPAGTEATFTVASPVEFPDQANAR